MSPQENKHYTALKKKTRENFVFFENITDIKVMILFLVGTSFLEWNLISCGILDSLPQINR